MSRILTCMLMDVELTAYNMQATHFDASACYAEDGTLRLQLCKLVKVRPSFALVGIIDLCPSVSTHHNGHEVQCGIHRGAP